MACQMITYDSIMLTAKPAYLNSPELQLGVGYEYEYLWASRGRSDCFGNLELGMWDLECSEHMECWTFQGKCWLVQEA